MTSSKHTSGLSRRLRSGYLLAFLAITAFIALFAWLQWRNPGTDLPIGSNANGKPVATTSQTQVSDSHSKSHSLDAPIISTSKPVDGLNESKSTLIEDRMGTVLSAASSSNAKLVWRGILAERECRGLANEDISSLENSAAAAARHDVDKEQRIAAARAFVSACGRFAHQGGLSEISENLHNRLFELRPELRTYSNLAESISKDKNPSPGLLTPLCEIITTALLKRDAAAIDVVQPAINRLIISKYSAPNSKFDAQSILLLASERLECEARQDCLLWTPAKLIGCTAGGICDPKSFVLQQDFGASVLSVKSSHPVALEARLLVESLMSINGKEECTRRLSNV